jgi:hypothetical protein
VAGHLLLVAQSPGGDYSTMTIILNGAGYRERQPVDSEQNKAIDIIITSKSDPSALRSATRGTRDDRRLRDIYIFVFG